MTIASSSSRDSYSGNGSTTAFTYNFQIADDDDIKVILVDDDTGVETVQTKTTHYSVSGVGSASGTVTMVTAPASGETLVLIRNTTFSQETDYTENDPFPAASHEAALDKLTTIAQQLKEIIDRCVKRSDGDISTGSIELPVAVEGAYLLFGANGAIESSTSSPTSLGEGLAANSTTSVAIGTGSKSFTIETGKSFSATMVVRMADAAAPTINFMIGSVTSYNPTTGALVVNVTSVTGSGTKADWDITLSGDQGAAGDVTNTGSASDNELVRFHSNEDTIQGGTGITIDDNGMVSGAGRGIVQVTGTTKTLALTDEGTRQECNNASAQTITIPTNASVAFPVGAEIEIVQFGAGTVTITADTGVTLNGVSTGSCDILAQYRGAFLYKQASNVWIVMGSITGVT